MGRAIVGIALSVTLRLLREGLVLRALVWPGLLVALTLMATVAGLATWGSVARIAVADAAVAAAFEEAGFVVQRSEDPYAALLEKQVTRAVWREPDGSDDGERGSSRWVLGFTLGGRDTHRAEGVLRDYARDRWRLVVPPREARPAVVDQTTGLLAGVTTLLFTLYGVVLGAGALYRDRAGGSLECDLALAVPRWTHAVGRLLSLGVVLGVTLTASLLLIHSLIAVDRLATWILVGATAALGAGAIGLDLMARADAQRGFSPPLSRGLVVVAALMSGGWALPAYGRFLPIASLGAALAGTAPSMAIVPGSLLLAGLVAWLFHRRDTL
jgi:hypothetical protein